MIAVKMETTAQVQKSLAPDLGEKQCTKSSCSKSLWPAIRILLKIKTKPKPNNPDSLGRTKIYCKKNKLKEYKKDELSLSKTPLLQKAKLLTMTNEALQGSFKKVNFRVS